jgi:hypothetical protein
MTPVASAQSASVGCKKSELVSIIHEHQITGICISKRELTLESSPFTGMYVYMPIPVAARSKTWVCVRSPAETILSNLDEAWMFVCYGCCLLSGRCQCDELITRPEKSYRMWCVVVCGLETSRRRRPWPAFGRSITRNMCIY